MLQVIREQTLPGVGANLQLKDSDHDATCGRGACSELTQICLPHSICNCGESCQPENGGCAFRHEHRKRVRKGGEISGCDNGVRNRNEEGENGNKDVEDDATGDIEWRQVSVQDVGDCTMSARESRLEGPTHW